MSRHIRVVSLGELIENIESESNTNPERAHSLETTAYIILATELHDATMTFATCIITTSRQHEATTCTFNGSTADVH